MRVSLHHSSKYTKSTLPHCREPSLSSLAGEGPRTRHCYWTLEKYMLHVSRRAVCRREPRHRVRADITRLSRSCVRLVAALGIWASCPSFTVQVCYW